MTAQISALYKMPRASDMPFHFIFEIRYSSGSHCTKNEIFYYGFAQ